ncbi:MAG: hypothetical protein U9R15_15805, partial [Chloroflexota bacterium]|nr:hypothetical protein [Chloroflexota bacterium]
VGDGLFHAILTNDNLDVDFENPRGVTLVSAGFPSDTGYRVVAADLVDSAHPWRHDSDKLARALLGML